MKQHILVAGVDYEFHGLDFRQRGENLRARLTLANTMKTELRFTLFDARAGEKVVTDVTYPAGKKVETSVRSTPFRKVTPAMYDAVPSAEGGTHNVFKDGQRGVLSITDVYAAVRDIGRATPGSLEQLHLFSHAWMGGPILVNSFDDRMVRVMVPFVGVAVDLTIPGTARDPDDFDPRPQFDFVPPTMDAAALAEFKAAFASTGLIWLWGCALPRAINRFLSKVESSGAYRSSGLGDDVELTLADLSAEERGVLDHYLVPDAGPFVSAAPVKIKFKHVKLFMCRVNQAGYSARLAAVAGVPVQAALLGTSADFDETGSLPLMSVDPAFQRHFTFYKNYLGFSFDTEGRHYGVYLPAFTCPVP